MATGIAAAASTSVAPMAASTSAAMPAVVEHPIDLTGTVDIECSSPCESAPSSVPLPTTSVMPSVHIAVPVSAARESVTIKNAMVDTGDHVSIPVSLPADIVRVVMDFCALLAQHSTELTDFAPKRKSKVVQWQQDFIARYVNDHPILFRMLKAANYLHVQQLLDLTAFTIAQALNGKNVAGMREYLQITNPGLTLEQEHEIIKEGIVFPE